MEALLERLDDERPKVRAQVAGELVDRCRADESERERWGMRFLTLLNDPSPAVRGQAVVGAVLCDADFAHVDRVLRLISDPSPGVRLQVIHTLGPLGLPQVPDAFAAALGDEDERVRTTAASALAHAGDARGFDVLLAALDRRDTREEALYALRHLAGRGDDQALARGVRRIFGALLASRTERVAAAAVLAALGDREGTAHLVERAGKRGHDRPLALELVGELRLAEAEPLLLATAHSRTDPYRGTALRALGSLQVAEARQLCTEALLDPAEDLDVRCDAAEGLLLHGGREAEAALQQAEQQADDERLRRVVEASLSLFGRDPREIRLYLPLSGEEVA